MVALEFLVYAVLISLAQGQVAVSRSQDWQQQVLDSQQMLESSAAPENISDNNPEDLEEEVIENARPENWRDLLAINQVSNLSDFINLLVSRDGQPVREEDLFSPEENADGKRVIQGSGELMAESDECSPRNVSVRLDLDLFDPEVAYYPECTKVQRCGGCTPTPYLACEPLYKEIIILSVLKARYPYPGALSMEIEGFAPVRVERHLTCRAVCTLKPEDCGPHRTYLKNQCRCKCDEMLPCSSNKAWDMDLCECRCRNQRPCCGPRDAEGRRCPLFFDPVYCECTLKESVGGPPHASQAEMEAYLRVRHGQRPGDSADLFTVGPLPGINITTHQPSVTSSTTTTTTSTTTPPTTTRASCRHLRCPRRMVGAMNPSGLCVCVFPQNQRPAAQRMGQRQGVRRG